MRKDERKEVVVVPIFDTEGPSYGRDDLYGRWEELLDAMLIMANELRSRMLDDEGHPMIFSWFVLDWVGYDKNEASFQKRKQATGYHHVFDQYCKYIFGSNAWKRSGDGLYWHYHHPPKDGSWGWNRNWNDSKWYENVLNRKILERNFFPSVFRAGGYVEDDNTSAWLERWIPFDYSNNSPAFKRNAYDWSRAKRDWLPYHPSRNDYQTTGDMRRIIARSLPVEAKGGSNKLTEKDVMLAFSEAAGGKRPILSFSTHDYYKSAADEFYRAYELIQNARKQFLHIPWRYTNALDAVRWSLKLSTLPALKLSAERKGSEIVIRSNHELFGDMPYITVCFGGGREVRLDVEKISETAWILKKTGDAVKLGIGAGDAYGNTDVITYIL